MKSILLIGLGRYGRHVARKLHAMHHEIMAVDRNEELVNEVLPYTNSALIADSTDGHFLESLGVRNFDACIVAIGDDFQSSLETTLRLKELGAQYVVSRASRGIHEKFLLRNGADEVVYPEKQLANWTAIRWPATRSSPPALVTRSTAMASVCSPRSSPPRFTVWPRTMRPTPSSCTRPATPKSPTRRKTW